MTLPIPLQYFNRVTRPFGLLSNDYTSGMHPGADFGTPIGTPVVAPCDGYVTMAIHDRKNSQLGNAIYFAFIWEDQVYFMASLHMSEIVSPGMYKQGDVLGKTGNTGKSSGPHAHLEIWNRSIDRGAITTKAGVQRNLLNPVDFFKTHADSA